MQKEHTEYTDVLIIGGGYAGRYAAARVRTRDSSLSVTLIDPNDGAIQRARSHETAADRQVTTRPWHELLPSEIRFVQGWAEQLDADRRRCTITPTDRERRRPMAFEYRALIITTGSTVRMIPSDDSVRSYAVDDPMLGRHTQNANSFTVVGAGLSGVEVACELRERFQLPVELIGPEILPTSSAKATAYAQKRLEELGVRHIADRTTTIEDGCVMLENGAARSADMVICANGFDCTSPFEMPVELQETLQNTGSPNIFHAGDQLAGFRNGLAYRPSCALAIPSGVHAGENVVRFLHDKPLEIFRFGTLFRLISIGRSDGIIDRTHLDGVPRNSITTGRLAAFAKERVLRMTDWALRLELFTRLPIYSWPKPARRPTLADKPLLDDHGTMLP